MIHMNPASWMITNSGLLAQRMRTYEASRWFESNKMGRTLSGELSQVAMSKSKVRGLLPIRVITQAVSNGGVRELRVYLLLH